MAAALVAACGGGADTDRAATEGRTGRQEVPRGTSRFVHETFHRTPRLCARPSAERRRLDSTTERFIELYRRYPPGRFRMTIHEDTGTMLSAILVLRAELSRCSPDHARRIDRALPRRISRALPPPGRG